MIRELRFALADTSGVAPARFVARAGVPIGAACVVANGIRETLRELFHEGCDVTIGEPVAIDTGSWNVLARDAYCFLTRGRQTDIVLVVPPASARAVVQRAFGETEAAGSEPMSALELHALERIAARCATTFDPLCAERHGIPQTVAADALPACVAFFDVRVNAPVRLELGIGLVRDVPAPTPADALPPAALARVPLAVRVEFATGCIDARTLVRLRPGDIVRLDTQVGAAASLKIADTYLASGFGGISAGHYCFEVHTFNEAEARSGWRP